MNFLGKHTCYDHLKDKVEEMIEDPHNFISENTYKKLFSACDIFTKTFYPKKIDLHISDGEIAKPNEFPYVAALGYKKLVHNDNTIEYDCGGTLISTQHVLTAAHCVDNHENKVPTEVRMGSHDLRSNNTDVQRILIDDIICHPRYKRSQHYNDIAIIKLEKPIKVTAKVKPICLLTESINENVFTSNASFIVTGWGDTGFGEKRSPILRKTPNMSLVQLENCSSYYVDLRRLPIGLDNSMLCAIDLRKEHNADACQGDSGGPMVMISEHSETIVGITSFGQACGTSVPSVYMSVYHYVSWIESVIWPHNNNNKIS